MMQYQVWTFADGKWFCVSTWENVRAAISLAMTYRQPTVVEELINGTSRGNVWENQLCRPLELKVNAS